MRSETSTDNRVTGRPNTIRNLISGMNNNANSSSLTAHLQHQSITQQTDDDSMLHKVNLAAAFHDHISCTKAGGNINSLIAYQVNNDANVKKLPSCDTLLFGTAPEEDDDKEQISKLKSMILVQLDLIQYQQEQLLKKDRQLQGLKQDREALCLRLEKMEKRITYLTSKLANVNENSGEDTETIIDSKDSETNDSLDTFCNIFNDSSSVLQRIYSNASSNSNVCVLNANSVLNVANNQLSIINAEPSSSSQNVNALTAKDSDEKSAKKRSLICKESSLSAKKKNRASKPLENDVKTNLVNPKSVSNLNQINDKSKLCCKKRKPNGKLKKSDSSVEDSIELEPSSNLGILEALSPYDVFVNREVCPEDEESAGDIETESNLIEVPSWRLHPISSCYSLEGTENLDDEVFSRRHSKLEIDERRRKRWDIQRLREQKNNERLRSGRYSGYLDKPSDKKEDTIEIYTFFPEAKDVEYIEVCDKLPVVAFGHPIPQLPERYFSLPWLSSTTKQRNFQKSVNS